MLEAALVIGKNGRVRYEHVPKHRSAGHIPDSSALWRELVTADAEDDLVGVAHSHPGVDLPRPSREDVTTFSAVERGLGRRLTWWITAVGSGETSCWRDDESPLGTVRCHYVGEVLTIQPFWVTRLLTLSKEVSDGDGQ